MRSCSSERSLRVCWAGPPPGSPTTRPQDSLERDLQRSETSFLIATLSLERSHNLDAANGLLATYRRALSDSTCCLHSIVERVRPKGASQICQSSPNRWPGRWGPLISSTNGWSLKTSLTSWSGERLRERTLRLFFLFPEAQIQRQISQLGTVLFTGWLILVAASGPTVYFSLGRC